MRDVAWLLIAGAGGVSPLLHQEVHHQENRTQRSAVMFLVV
jgi:hypothetical protein